MAFFLKNFVTESKKKTESQISITMSKTVLLYFVCIYKYIAEYECIIYQTYTVGTHIVYEKYFKSSL